MSEFNDPFYKKDYVLTTNCGNSDDELLISSALDLFQDAAGKHASLISEDFESLKTKGMGWILTRNRVEFMKKVSIEQNVYVNTYQSNIGKASYEREYFICDKDTDEILVKANSRWCVIDINNGKIIPTNNVKNNNSFCDLKAFEENFRVIPSFKEEEMDLSFMYKVIYTDIDHNKHMNNTRYVAPIINYFQRNIRKLEMNYLKQSYLGDELIYFLKSINENSYFVYIFNKNELVNKCYIEID